MKPLGTFIPLYCDQDNSSPQNLCIGKRVGYHGEYLKLYSKFSSAFSIEYKIKKVTPSNGGINPSFSRKIYEIEAITPAPAGFPQGIRKATVYATYKLLPGESFKPYEYVVHFQGGYKFTYTNFELVFTTM